MSGALFSQAQILQLMKNEFARSRRHGIPLGCVLLQVDRLAQLVDLYGLGLRQAVRTAIAEMVRERTRGPDLLGATSDDRYLLMLPHTELEQTRTVAKRLRHRFAELELQVDGRELALTLSIGITASVDRETMFFDSLVAQAEAAVECAAELGGDRVVSFAEARVITGVPDGPGDPEAPEAPGAPEAPEGATDAGESGDADGGEPR